jgi:hypothetical protein
MKWCGFTKSYHAVTFAYVSESGKKSYHDLYRAGERRRAGPGAAAPLAGPGVEPQ